MGLFSKLFGTVNDNIIKTIKNDITGSSSEDPWNKTQERPANKKPDAPRSGFSWGDVMPDEENQYNFNGTYQQYFENIFRFYFSEYYIRLDYGQYNKMPRYSFFRDNRCVLVIELMSEKSSSQKLRNECRKSGIPYLRYYIDHKDWWNTREYVVTRTRNALKY